MRGMLRPKCCSNVGVFGGDDGLAQVRRNRLVRDDVAPLDGELADDLAARSVDAGDGARRVVVERRDLRQIAGIGEDHAGRDAEQRRDEEQRDRARRCGRRDRTYLAMSVLIAEPLSGSSRAYRRASSGRLRPRPWPTPDCAAASAALGRRSRADDDRRRTDGPATARAAGAARRRSDAAAGALTVAPAPDGRGALWRRPARRRATAPRSGSADRRLVRIAAVARLGGSRRASAIAAPTTAGGPRPLEWSRPAGAATARRIRDRRDRRAESPADRDRSARTARLAGAVDGDAASRCDRESVRGRDVGRAARARPRRPLRRSR